MSAGLGSPHPAPRQRSFWPGQKQKGMGAQPTQLGLRASKTMTGQRVGNGEVLPIVVGILSALPAPASMHFFPGLDALANLCRRSAGHQATCVELMGGVIQPQKVVNHGGLANAPGPQEEHHWLGSNLSICGGKERAVIWNKAEAALLA